MIWFTVSKAFEQYGTNNDSPRSRLSVRCSLSFLLTVTCFWLLTFPPHHPYLLSFHSPWAVWCMALLKRLFLPRVVLISNKRSCGTRVWGGASWHSNSLFIRCRELQGPVLRPSRLHSSSSPCFSIHTEASHMHRSSRVSIATPVFFFFFFFYLTHMAALLTLILRSRYQGTIHSLAWGRWQKCLCFPFCVQERERKERERREDEMQ